MARTISWISRLEKIRASVEKSPLTLWERSDLESLFELQPRQANKLIEVLPRGRGPGGALLVERDALLAFLAKVERTGKLPRARTKVSRKKLRLTVRPVRDVGKGSVAAIPKSVKLRPGRLEVDFRDGADLVAQLWAVGLAARDDEAAFLALVEEAPAPRTKNEGRELLEELEQMEAAFAGKKKPVKVA